MPDAVSNIQVGFSEDIYNATSRMLTTLATISWTAPDQLYGVFQEYSIEVQSPLGTVTYQDTSASSSIMATIEVLPAEVYSVTVSVTTGGGSSSNTSSFTSPEAG